MVYKYSTHCFSLDFGSECLQRRKKSLSIFVHDSKKKEDDKIVLQRVGFEISRERQGLLLQSRKMAKYVTKLLKNHWNHRGIELNEFLSKRGKLFWLRSGQASDEVARGLAPDYGQVARKSSRPKSCRLKPESCRPKFIIMLPNILSHVAQNFIMLKKILKVLVRVKCETVNLRLFVSPSLSWR